MTDLPRRQVLGFLVAAVPVVAHHRPGHKPKPTPTPTPTPTPVESAAYGIGYSMLGISPLGGVQ